jgi:hypothetical protein
MCALLTPAAAQPKKGDKAPPPVESKQVVPSKGEKKEKEKEKEKVKNFDFNALDLNGRMRTPQLLYFLERANEELERASLEKRSFIPHMVRSVEEEQL